MAHEGPGDESADPQDAEGGDQHAVPGEALAARGDVNGQPVVLEQIRRIETRPLSAAAPQLVASMFVPNVELAKSSSLSSQRSTSGIKRL